MNNITIFMRNGETKNFPHEGRPGGSFTKTIRYEGAFAIITDEYFNETAIPAEIIKEIKISKKPY